MKTLYLIFAFLLFNLSGCADQTTVHVYAKYLDSNQIEKVSNAFEKSTRYRVELNDFDFPTSVTQNTLLYSLLLLAPDDIDIALTISAEAGFPVQHIQGLKKGNHWYTNNAIALFLFPDNKDSGQIFFMQDLVNEYKGKGCIEASSLKLNKNGSFTLQTASSSDGTVSGVWKYRQYPFLELQKEGNAYAEYYFEIKRFTGADKVSEIDFIELVSLNEGSLPKGCSFLIGTRV